MQTTTLGSKPTISPSACHRGRTRDAKHRAPEAGPGAGRERARPGPTTTSQDSAPLRRDAWAVVGGESASVPSAAKGETATVPSAAVGETTAGVAVVAAVAAILARSMGPKPITERGGERIQASRRGRSGRGGHGRGWSVQADHGGGRAGPGRSRPGENVRADHGGGRGARAGPGRGGRGAPCAGEPAQESLLKEERERTEPRARCAPGDRARVGQGWNARRHGRAEISCSKRVKRAKMRSAFRPIMTSEALYTLGWRPLTVYKE